MLPGCVEANNRSENTLFLFAFQTRRFEMGYKA